MTDRTCRSCRHSRVIGDGTEILCDWERNFLPPPVFSAPTWVRSTRPTFDEWAKDCQQYAAKGEPT